VKYRVIALLLVLVLTAFVSGRTQQATSSVSGSVVEQGSGVPLSGVRIALAAVGGREVASGTTDAQGKFSLEAVTPGHYMVQLTKAGYLTPGPSTAMTLDLSGARKETTLEYRLVPGAVITGRVYDEVGDPVTAARVGAYRLSYRDGVQVLTQAGERETDDLGSYRIFGLLPGSYYVYGIPPARGPGQSSAGVFYPGVFDGKDAVPVALGAGKEVRAIDFSLRAQPVFRITMRVILGPTTETSGPRFPLVYLFPRGGSLDVAGSTPARCSTTPDGLLECSAAPGTYDLLAILNVADASARLSGRLSVTVADQDVDAGTLVLTPPKEVSGRVVVREGVPDKVDLTHLRVRLAPVGYLPPTLSLLTGSGVPVGSDGTFLLRTPDLPTQLTLTGIPPNTYVESLRLNGLDAQASDLNLFAQSVESLELNIAGPGGRLIGTVIAEDGRVVPQATVALVPPIQQRKDPTAYKSYLTPASGHFSFQGIPPGDYKLFAWESIEAGAYANADFIGKIEHLGTVITIRKGETVSVDVRPIPKN
jgi:hypothetical protein